jgi:sugar phosphate isomerase/epimerase
MASIGFSTGALSLGDFGEALHLMSGLPLTAVELSALRIAELPTLIGAIPQLDLAQFSYIAVHSPSRFLPEEEDFVIDLLQHVPAEWPIVLHPDTIHRSEKWARFGAQLALENMDRRKPNGRSAEEIAHYFDELPDARLCLDLAHAHQYDKTMTEAFRMLTRFGDRICQLHVSELDSAGRHFALSYATIAAFTEIASLIPADAPIIIESLDPLRREGSREQQLDWMGHEVSRALLATGRGNWFARPEMPAVRITAEAV